MLKQIFLILSKSSSTELVMFLACCLIQSAESYIFTSIPLLYMSPDFICEKDGFKYKCSQNEACEIGTFSVDTTGFTKSIAIKFGLYCGSQRTMLMVGQMLQLLGNLIPAIFFSMVKVNPKYRYLWMTIGIFLSGFFAFISSFQNNITFLFIFICLYYIAFNCYYINIYSFLREQFNEELQELAPAILAIFYGVGTMLYATFDKYYKDYQLGLRYFYGGQTVTFSIILFISYKYKQSRYVDRSQTLLEEFVDDQAAQQNIQAIWKIQNIRKVLIIFTFLWVSVNIAYVASELGISTLFGNIYTNITILGLIESISAVFVGIMVVRFSIKLLNQVAYLLIGLSLVIYFFQPQHHDAMNQLSEFMKMFFIAPFFVAKFAIEASWTFVINLMMKYTPINSQQSIFSFACIISTGVLLLAPYYTKFCEDIYLSPFSFYGVLNILAFLSLYMLKNPESYQDSDDSTSESESECDEVRISSSSYPSICSEVQLPVTNFKQLSKAKNSKLSSSFN